MRAAQGLLSLFESAGAPAPAAPAASTAPAVPIASTLSAAHAGHITPPSSLAGAALSAHLWRAESLDAGQHLPVQSTGFAALDAELPGGGWPQGQLIELLLDTPGIGELSLLAPALAAATRQRNCVCVLPQAQSAAMGVRAPHDMPLPYAPAWQSVGIHSQRCVFVQPATARETWWTLEQSLRSGHLGAVIGWLPDSGTHGTEADFRALRRLHLLAAQRQALVFVLRSTRHARSPSPAALRLQLTQHDGQLQIQILKRRGRPLLEPVSVQVHPADWRHVRVAPPARGADVDEPAAGTAPSAAVQRRHLRWSMKALFSH
jgi:hypothetical protein